MTLSLVVRFPREARLPRWKSILRRDLCAYCLASGGTVDHVRARSLGGRNLDNLTGACRQCNTHKAAHSLLRFLRTHGYPVRLY